MADRMGRGAQFVGRALDALIPGNAFNSYAPSFGQGWTTSGWGRGFSNAQQGNYGQLGSEVGSVIGGRFVPIIGNQVGRWAGEKLGNALSGGNWTPSNYGPYTSGYQGLSPSLNNYYPDFSSLTNYGQPSEVDYSQGYPGIAQASDIYGNNGSRGMSSNNFASGMNWGGGTGGAILSNLGMASGVKAFGGYGGPATSLNPLNPADYRIK